MFMLYNVETLEPHMKKYTQYQVGNIKTKAQKPLSV